MKTVITELFGIEHPIIQGGMIWVSGGRLAAAVSEAGALGLIGAGSMKADLLREQIRKARDRTTRPFGVNLPLMRGDAADLAAVIVGEGIRIVFTSAGTPRKFTPLFKEHGCVVVHVVANVKQAKNAAEAGCDAVVAEGCEAGGHNGVDEITTFCLIPQVADAVPVPVIAAGGIADGRGMLAAFALGAHGVQVGTRFAASIESSAHEVYKRMVVEAGDNGTLLTLKKLAPTRLLRNDFALKALEMEQAGASREELLSLLGDKRERAGIFEGNLTEGEFEAGQCAGLIRDIPSAAEIVGRMMHEFHAALRSLRDAVPD